MSNPCDYRVLVTGGAVRVGRDICRALNKAGAQVVIHYRNSEAAAKELAAELETIAVQGDLSLAADRERIFREAGTVNGLVNNASDFHPCGILDEPEAALRARLEVNLIAPLEMMKLFRAQLHGAPGVVVNLLDQEVLHPSRSYGGYSLAKKGLRDATLAAALQYAHENLRVNGLAPGPVYPPPGLEHSRMEKTLKTVPLGRPVAPEDLAAGCVFLIGNSSVTGQVLCIDCGQSLGAERK
jgi:hypothetical protein